MEKQRQSGRAVLKEGRYKGGKEGGRGFHQAALRRASALSKAWTTLRSSGGERR